MYTVQAVQNNHTKAIATLLTKSQFKNEFPLNTMLLPHEAGMHAHFFHFI